LCYNGFNSNRHRVETYFSEDKIEPQELRHDKKLPDGTSVVEVGEWFDVGDDVLHMVVKIQTQFRKPSWIFASGAMNHKVYGKKFFKQTCKLLDDNNYDIGHSDFLGSLVQVEYREDDEPTSPQNEKVLGVITQHVLGALNEPEFTIAGRDGFQYNRDEHEITQASHLGLNRANYVKKLVTIETLLRKYNMSQDELCNPVLKKKNKQNIFIPASYAELLAMPDCDHKTNFLLAYRSEIDSLYKTGTGVKVPIPKGRKLVGSKVIFEVKFNNLTGDLDKYKCRVVAQGFSQIHGIDYTETFSATPMISTIKTVVSTSVQKDWELYSIDIKTAFLNADLEEDIYLRIPDGEQQTMPDGTPACWQLHRAIYGLKQASRAWLHTFTSYLEDIGLKRSPSEPCLFWLPGDGGEMKMMLFVHVDDCGFGCKPDDGTREWFLQKIGERFQYTDNGVMETIVNMNLDRQADGSIIIHQRAYIEAMLHKFGLQNSKPASTPLPTRYDLDIRERTDEEMLQMKDVDYLGLLGALLWVQRCSRFDISFAVAYMARANKAPRLDHYKQLQRIARYLKSTLDIGVKIQKLDDSHPLLNAIVTYTDADFATGKDNRRSTSGVITFYNGVPIEYCAKLQSCVTANTAEAEYTALARGVSDTVYLRQLLKEMDLLNEGPSVVYGDNTASLAIGSNDMLHTRVKHVDIKLHFVRDYIRSKDIQLKYIDTTNQLADLFTKSLGSDQFQKLRDTILTLCDRFH